MNAACEQYGGCVSQLASTGFDAYPILLAGLALIVAGITLWQRVERSPDGD